MNITHYCTQNPCPICHPPKFWPSSPGAWICPKCGSVYGPQAHECHRCNKPVELKITYGSGEKP